MFTGTIGNGSSIRFWIDPWFNNKPLSITFPDLYKLEKFKGCSIKDLWTRRGTFLQRKWNWKKPPSTPIELHQLQELLASVYNINLSDSPDKWSWAHDPSNNFTTKSMTNLLQNASYGPKRWSFPWNKLAPLKSNVLGWKLEMNRVPTYDLLLRRNIAIPSLTCHICNNHQETSHHLFLTCSFADELWTYITAWCKLASGKPSNIRTCSKSINNQQSIHQRQNTSTLSSSPIFGSFGKPGTISFFHTRSLQVNKQQRRSNPLAFSGIPIEQTHPELNGQSGLASTFNSQLCQLCLFIFTIHVLI